MALLAWPPGTGEGAHGRPIEVLDNEVVRAGALAQECDYARLSALLAGVLTGLGAYVGCSSGLAAQRHGLELLADACHAAFVLLMGLGYGDLAGMAAERHAAVSAWLGDPVRAGVSGFLRAHILLAAGAAESAAAIASASAGELGGQHAPAASQASGMLQLTRAYAAVLAGRSRDAGSHLDEACELASRLGEGQAFHLYFGPANVAIWKVAIGVERGEGPQVTEYVQAIDTRVVSRARRARMHADLARGLAADRHYDREATAMLARAEDLAPQWLRSYAPARLVAIVLLTRARAGMAGSEIRGLAYRMGIS